MLVDAGPLKALFDAREPNHRICVEALGHLSGPLLTTWPAFTEAMYLLGAAGGWSAQQKLWAMHQRKLLMVIDLPSRSVERAQVLMEKYVDMPMSLADATLVSLAELRNLNQIFTLDSDFTVYRFRGRRSFQVIPKPG